MFNRRRSFILAACVAASVPLVSRATTTTYVGPVNLGSWNNPNNWFAAGVGGGVPFANETAFISNNDGFTRNVILDVNTANLGTLLISNTGVGGSAALTQTNNFNVTAIGETIGANGLHTQGNGFNTYSSFLYLDGAGVAPTYNLSGTGSILISGNSMTSPGTDPGDSTSQLPGSSLIIGAAKAANFNQIGTSTVTLGNAGVNLYVGYDTNGTGTYSLGGGTLNVVGGEEFIGYNGKGNFLQSAGMHTLGTATLPNGLTLGEFGNSNGTYSLSGNGTLTVFGAEAVGNSGTGSFLQSAGVNNINASISGGGTFAGDLGVAASPSSLGTYSLSGTGVLNVHGIESIGPQNVVPLNSPTGVGQFIQNGGTNNLGSTAAGDSGTLAINNGGYALNTGTLNVLGTENISFFPTNIGTFVQAGGIHSVGTTTLTGSLNIASGPNSIGSYLLKNSGALNVYGTEVVGGSISTGTFTQTGGTHTAQSLQVATTNGGIGEFDLSNSTGSSQFNVSGSAYIGGTNTQAGGTATLSIASGTMTVGGTLKLWGGDPSNPSAVGGVVNLFGGTLGVGTIDDAIKPANFNWASGTLNFSSNLLFATGNSLGPSINLQSNRSLVVNGSTTINPGSTLTLNGGLFATGALINNGIFQFTTGTFRLTNSALSIGTTGFFGNNVQLQSNQRIEVTGGATSIDAGALLYLTGGTVLASGGTGVSLTNNGQIDLASPLSQISGGTLANNGLINGTGRIAMALNNGSLGIVRASGTDWLQFSAPSNTNSGQIQLLNGGGVEFTQAMTNAGTISGRGVLLATGGLTNTGTIQTSGGFTDIYGSVSNIGKVTVTGGSTTTFYNAVDTSVGSVTVNTNSTVVFLGAVAGLSHITGPGTKDFESGTFSGGAIATVIGSTIIGPSASGATDYFNENALTVYGSAKTLTGTSNLNTLIISGGTLDLGNHDLVVTSTPLLTIAGYIASAYNAGSWNGAGLTSTSAQATSTSAHKTALGYATASAINVSSFDGQPVGGSTVLVRYTDFGDANLDGVVNALDFNAIATNYGKSSKFWSDGDFDFNGSVNSGDFDALANNFGQSIVGQAATASESLVSISGSLVPEPAMIAPIVALGILLRRRRALSGVL